MRFSEEVAKYLQYKIDNIDDAKKEEKKVFDELPNPSFIENYWNFFRNLRLFFDKMCTVREKLDPKSKFLKNVKKHIGNSSTTKLELGAILNASWPIVGTSSFKKEYRKKIKEIAKHYIIKANNVLKNLNEAKTDIKKFEDVKQKLLRNGAASCVRGYDGQTMKKDLEQAATDEAKRKIIENLHGSMGAQEEDLKIKNLSFEWANN